MNTPRQDDRPASDPRGGGPTTSDHFGDRLAAAIARVGSPACIGIDPVFDRLPPELRPAAGGPSAALDTIGAFCRGVLGAGAGVAAAVKFQSACFERYGGAGVSLLSDLCRGAAAAGYVVVLDAKRGDIGVTAEHYAAAAATTGAHALTVNGYLGAAAVRPFLAAGLGVFVLVRTSNPESDELQAARLASGRTVAEHLAVSVAALGREFTSRSGYSSVGAVVGATKSADGPALRAAMPRQFFLVPGVGAQGGGAGDVRQLLNDRGGGVLVTASRSVIYPERKPGEAWDAAVGRAAREFAGELRMLGPVA